MKRIGRLFGKKEKSGMPKTGLRNWSAISNGEGRTVIVNREKW